MTTRALIKGLQTLLPFYDNQDGYHTGAEHDVIYGDPTNKPLSDKAIEIMISLGWHQEYDGRDYDKDFSKENYREDEGWQFYT